MSEIRSVELVMVDGRLTMFTKINGVPQSEFSTSYVEIREFKNSSLMDHLCDHLQMNKAMPEDWVDY